MQHSPFHKPHSLHQISRHCILQYLSMSPWHTDEHIPNGSWWKWESIPFQDLWMVSCHKPRLSFSETDFCSSLFPSFSGIVQRIIPTTLGYIPRSLNTNTILMKCLSKYQIKRKQDKRSLTSMGLKSFLWMDGVVWYKVIIVSALSLSLRDKDRLRDWEIERELDNTKFISSYTPWSCIIHIFCVYSQNY